MAFVNLTKRALQLRFQGRKDRLPNNFTGSNLQAMRLLTPASAFQLEKAWNNGTGDTRHLRDLAEQADKVEHSDLFDPENVSDGRERLLREIVNRQGQPAFRNRILDAYGRRCAITNSNVVETLEAAHICPYRGTHTNKVPNGILLRADIHTLFDLRLIAIDTSDYSILIADRLKDSPYARFSGRPVRPPSKHRDHPNKQALDEHRRKARL
jgi:putative restriction endonuclease